MRVPFIVHSIRAKHIPKTLPEKIVRNGHRKDVQEILRIKICDLCRDISSWAAGDGASVVLSVKWQVYIYKPRTCLGYETRLPLSSINTSECEPHKTPHTPASRRRNAPFPPPQI